jgi:hypothetical protein
VPEVDAPEGSGFEALAFGSSAFVVSERYFNKKLKRKT